MPNVRSHAVDVYVYRKQSEHFQFLLLRRSNSVLYAGQWRMVGGKIKSGETASGTARREIEEETGRKPLCMWTLPSVNVFYEHDADSINLIPAFAAEINGDPVLNHEHHSFAWLNPDEALESLVWPEQKRLLALAAEILTGGKILPEWEIRT